MPEGRRLVAGSLEGGRMRGDEIRFILTAGADGRVRRQEYSGRVSDDAIRGNVKEAGGQLEWKATRIRRAG